MKITTKEKTKKMPYKVKKKPEYLPKKKKVKKKAQNPFPTDKYINRFLGL